MNDKSKDRAARRAAKRVGLRAMKSRRTRSSDNQGGYMLMNPWTNHIVGGERFDLTAEDVVTFCQTRIRRESARSG